MSFPQFCIPPSAQDFPTYDNLLYDKHTVIVKPVKPQEKDAVGGQEESYDADVTLVCNVQIGVKDDPTQFMSGGPRSGQIYTSNLTGLKTRDLVIYQGVRWRVKGTNVIFTNIGKVPHHLEADIEVIESSVG